MCLRSPFKFSDVEIGTSAPSKKNRLSSKGRSWEDQTYPKDEGKKLINNGGYLGQKDVRENTVRKAPVESTHHTTQTYTLESRQHEK